jgi:hypothetical protein
MSSALAFHQALLTAGGPLALVGAVVAILVTRN